MGEKEGGRLGEEVKRLLSREEGKRKRRRKGVRFIDAK